MRKHAVSQKISENNIIPPSLIMLTINIFPLQFGVKINCFLKIFLQSQASLIQFGFRALNLKLLEEVTTFLEILTAYPKYQVPWQWFGNGFIQSFTSLYHKIHSKRTWQCFEGWNLEDCSINCKTEVTWYPVLLLTLEKYWCHLLERSTKAIDPTHLSSSSICYYGYAQYKYNFKYSRQLNKITS